VDKPPVLIRRDAQRSLSFAIAWFLAIPAFVVGFASILWPRGYLLPHDCFQTDCPTETIATLVPPYLGPAIAVLFVAITASIALYGLTYRRSRTAWTIVAIVGLGLVVVGVVADVMARSGEVALMTFAWPIAPGLVALDAAWRGWRHSKLTPSP
jgi:hypothetical protein